MRFIATLADCMLSVILPRKDARAQTCWEVSCGCINHQKYTKVCCPGVCTSCEPTGVKC